MGNDNNELPNNNIEEIKNEIQSNINDNKELSNNNIEEIKNEIQKNINNLFSKVLQKKTNYNMIYINMNDINLLKKDILDTINKLFTKLEEIINRIKKESSKTVNQDYKIQKIEQLNYFTSKDFIKIESIYNLDFFTSKDIEDENKEITSIFQKEAYNQINEEEKIENESIAIFLKVAAQISRDSYLEANQLIKTYYKKFNESFKKNTITSLDEEENQKEFSSWVKSFEKNDKSQKKSDQNFFSDFQVKLTKMYLHCKLSFPSIEINFEKEEMFNSKKMIDFINRGPNRKVNFVILPSLYSNGNYLQNGKSWVFTYNKNTFYFNDIELKNLNNNNIKINEKIPNIIKNLKIIIEKKKSNNDKDCIVNTNYKISKNIKCSYLYYLRDKNNYIKKIPSEDRHLKIPKNFTIEKCDLIIGNKVITSNLI